MELGSNALPEELGEMLLDIAIPSAVPRRRAIDIIPSRIYAKFLLLLIILLVVFSMSSEYFSRILLTQYIMM